MYLTGSDTPYLHAGTQHLHMLNLIPHRSTLLSGTQDDLFKYESASRGARRSLGGQGSGLLIRPVLKELDVPVRAMILPLLNSTASDVIAEAVEEFLVSQTQVRPWLKIVKPRLMTRFC
jgi:hypothetical protein